MILMNILLVITYFLIPKIIFIITEFLYFIKITVLFEIINYFCICRYIMFTLLKLKSNNLCKAVTRIV